MKNSEQPEVRKSRDGEEFARFILVAANQCELAPEELFVAFSNIVAVEAVTSTASLEGALAVTRFTFEYALLCVRDAYERSSSRAVMQ